MKKILIIIIGILSISILALAHGGRIDLSGCHTKKSTGEYHCH